MVDLHTHHTHDLQLVMHFQTCGVTICKRTSPGTKYVGSGRYDGRPMLFCMSNLQVSGHAHVASCQKIAYDCVILHACSSLVAT